ncbi:hypothetical protein LshimejAT787_0804080 [Lyophyllum shimeji]|uniref:Uncharacterized protein n=1 Tax=Lyophyllum shimeji TaxID=47721 RepID=A0A9P3PQ23_LYOSH|nr:hypothetical protein LshimejAT787_0804080 [Lyophyllum shimeji]
MLVIFATMSTYLQCGSDMFNGSPTAEQIWQDWLNLEAFSSEPDVPRSCADHAISSLLSEAGLMPSTEVDVTIPFTLGDISAVPRSQLCSSVAVATHIDHTAAWSSPSITPSLFALPPLSSLEPLVQPAHLPISTLNCKSDEIEGLSGGNCRKRRNGSSSGIDGSGSWGTASLTEFFKGQSGIFIMEINIFCLQAVHRKS